MKTTAQHLAERYDFIGKLDFLMEVKKVHGSFKSGDLKWLCQFWNDTYTD